MINALLFIIKFIIFEVIEMHFDCVGLLNLGGCGGYF